MAWPQSDPHSAEGLFVPPNPLGKRNPGRRTDTRPNRSREDFSKMIDVDGANKGTQLTRTSRNMISPTSAVRTPPLLDFIVYVDSTYELPFNVYRLGLEREDAPLERHQSAL